jgi:Zn-dependent peptidase ImmA (M78 family)
MVLWRERRKREAKEIEAGFLKRCREYHWLEELCEIESPGRFPRYDAHAYSASTLGAPELAEMVGHQLDLGARPATSLAKILEEVYGVKIWYERLKNGGSGACVIGDFGPAILVNSSESPWRRNYDIGHELFHLLTWESFPPESLYADNQLNRTIEQAANTFASWLLLPAGVVLREFDRRRELGAIKYSTIVQMARDLDVSTEALLWRLERLGRISASEVERVLNDSAFRSVDKATMRERWWTPPVPPERFVRLAFFAYQRGRLSRARLAELLDTSLFNLTDKLLRYDLDDREDYETEISSP